MMCDLRSGARDPGHILGWRHLAPLEGAGCQPAGYGRHIRLVHGLVSGGVRDPQVRSAVIISVQRIIVTVCSYFKILRVTIDDEEIGMDIIKHGEAAYPVAAWREYQYRYGHITITLVTITTAECDTDYLQDSWRRGAD